MRWISPPSPLLPTGTTPTWVLAKVDVDLEQQLAAAFQIRSVPTVILVKDGQPVDGVFIGQALELNTRLYNLTEDQVKGRRR